MRRLVLLVTAALVAGACGGGSDDKPAPTTTPTTAVIEVTTAPPVTEAVPETTVPRGSPRTVTSLSTAMGPGSARIVGVVNGPAGPVTGAVVRIERFVGSAVATAEARTAAGTWSIDAILGGSYRVTIFRPPDLAQTAADVFFLAADETKSLTTNLMEVGTNSVTASIDPNPPVAGFPALLVVRFGSGTVDASGNVVLTPRPGIRVQLSLPSGFSLESVPIPVTDGTGAVAWQVRCLLPGQFPASILVGNLSSALVLPACVPAPVAPAPTVPATTTP